MSFRDLDAALKKRYPHDHRIRVKVLGTFSGCVSDSITYAKSKFRGRGLESDVMRETTSRDYLKLLGVLLQDWIDDH